MKQTLKMRFQHLLHLPVDLRDLLEIHHLLVNPAVDEGERLAMPEMILHLLLHFHLIRLQQRTSMMSRLLRSAATDVDDVHNASRVTRRKLLSIEILPQFRSFPIHLPSILSTRPTLTFRLLIGSTCPTKQMQKLRLQRLRVQTRRLL